jgi:SAM-dependent methyltransferase
MNYIEELNSHDNDNYLRYLKRMTDSMKVSTKGLIPFLTKNDKRILDVGCGSGFMLEALEMSNPTAELSGIDLNIEAINRLQLLGKNWKLYHEDFLNFNEKNYDTVIFSSILHEISSYNSDLSKRFTSIPIKESFIKTNEVLKDGGSIIIRDGLMVPEDNINNQLLVTFNDPNEVEWLYRFQEDFKGFDKSKVNKDIITSYPNEYLVSEAFLKEFLYTYTWGPESYHREINERFGILERNDWIRLLENNGFSIDNVIEASEEYEHYLKDKVSITDIYGNKYVYPSMTVLIKAIKR